MNFKTWNRLSCQEKKSRRQVYCEESTINLPKGHRTSQAINKGRPMGTNLTLPHLDPTKKVHFKVCYA